jgi:phosphotransferase system  glucose/maltose/N-acetylglucosamine-specific IIC component
VDSRLEGNLNVQIQVEPESEGVALAAATLLLLLVKRLTTDAAKGAGNASGETLRGAADTLKRSLVETAETTAEKATLLLVSALAPPLWAALELLLLAPATGRLRLRLRLLLVVIFVVLVLLFLVIVGLLVVGGVLLLLVAGGLTALGLGLAGGHFGCALGYLE